MTEQMNGFVACVGAVSDKVIFQLVAGMLASHLVHLLSKINFPFNFGPNTVVVFTAIIGCVTIVIFAIVLLPVREVVPHSITLREIQADGGVLGPQVSNVNFGNILLVHDDEPYCNTSKTKTTAMTKAVMV